MKPFEASRGDGRSDRQVILDMVHDGVPETLYPYDVLESQLQVSTTREIMRSTIGAAVRAANSTLLRESQRVLRVVTNQGYRMARADEHVGLALVRKDRAEVMFRKGVEILKGTRIDELDEPHRSLHQGTLMIMSGFYDALRTTQRRQESQQRAISNLLDRVTKLEKK